MKRHNNTKDKSSFDYRATLKILEARTSKVKQSKTNNHRKIRNSRENHRKSGEESSRRTHRKLRSPSKPESLHLRAHHFERSLWQCVKLILVLALCGSIQVSFAIRQRSHPSKTGTATGTGTSTSAAAAAFTSPPTVTINPASNELITSTSKYSRPFTIQQFDDDDADIFRPIIPKDMNLESISQNVFTKDGKYRVFENVDSDLRATLAMKRKDYDDEKYNVLTMPPIDGNDFAKQAKQSSKKPKKQQNESRNEIQKKQNTHSTFPQTISNETSSMKAESDEHSPQENPTIEGQRETISTTKSQFKSKVFSHQGTNKRNSTTPSSSEKEILAAELNGLESLLAEYLDELFNKGRYQPKPELVIALQKNFTEIKQEYEDEVGSIMPKSRTVRQAIERSADGELSLNIPRTLESGRLLFFAGLKKVMWPIYMGLQVLKSLMLALLLPTIIGSFGKLLGKGISSGSAPLFIRPMDEPQDLDFRDNNFGFDDDSNKFTLIDDAAGGGGGGGGGNVKDAGYAYNQAEASQAHNQYAYNAAGGINQRYSLNERQQLMQDSYLSALQSLGAASFKNSYSLSTGSSSSGGLNGLAGLTAPTRQKPTARPANMNTFQEFQKVPASSLLLSNYDPFYSPLLSRLDSVFAQLKLNSDDENCREKLICLMYANPAKYAPYSNLVSAQLSRELNELRKPTSDNPDILRFFKYMRAAKDGQDGLDCEKTFDKCKQFKDFENPAMVSTYHDINKLVQARKIS